jgi:hypothetical protein
LAALDGTSNAFIQIGSVLLIKVDEVPLVRTLTDLEMMIHLQHNPGLCQDPASALKELQRLVDNAAGDTSAISVNDHANAARTD